MKVSKEIYDYTFIEQADKEFLVDIIKRYRRLGGLATVFVLIPAFFIEMAAFILAIPRFLAEWNISYNWTFSFGSLAVGIVCALVFFVAFMLLMFPTITLCTDWCVDVLYRALRIEKEDEEVLDDATAIP
jgi:hypothetical protein